MNATIELIEKKAELMLHATPKPLCEKDVIELLSMILPAGTGIQKPCNVYNTLSRFSEFTKDLIKAQHLKEVKHCFTIVDTLLRKGNAHVRNAVENSYLFSLSALLDTTSLKSPVIKNLLPDSLKHEYMRQLNASGI